MLTIAEKRFVQVNLHGNVSALALQLGRFPDLDARKILRQIAGYQVLENKVPSWYACPDLLFPASLPLEQCSSETTARYKANLLDRKGSCCVSEFGNIYSMADLTGGLGIETVGIRFYYIVIAIAKFQHKINLVRVQAILVVNITVRA